MTTAKMRRLLPYMSEKEAVVLDSYYFQILISIENLNNISSADQVRQDRYDNPIPSRFLAPIDCLKIST
jgi:hypothetical protein